MKKRVAIVFVGQMRRNLLNSNQQDTDNIVTNSINNYLLTDEFKQRYDYDIYFSTDYIDVGRTCEFFGKEHVINIHSIECKTYMTPVEHDIPETYEYFHQKYTSIQFNGYCSFVEQLYQYYRLYDAYNMIADHIKHTGTIYDYVLRTRPDIEYIDDIIELFNILETSSKKIVVEHNILFIFHAEFMEHLFTIIKKYGTYTKSLLDDINLYYFLIRDNVLWTNGCNDVTYTFSSEKQCIDNIREYCQNNNLSVANALMGIRYPRYVVYLRKPWYPSA